MGQTNPYVASGKCSTTASSATQACFSITLTGNTFSNFGMLKTAISAPVIVDPALGLQYSGSILDLDTFYGPVKLEGNTFTNNIVKYASASSCDIAAQFASSGLAYSSANDNYQNFHYATYTASPFAGWNSVSESVTNRKTKLQIRSVISIVNHAHKIEIVKNKFTKNSGTKGIIYIDTYDRNAFVSPVTQSSPVIIAYNDFT